MKIKELLKKNNLSTKLLSLMIAMFLWSFVMGIVNPEYPVDYRGISVVYEGLQNIERQGLHLSSSPDEKVNVKLSGTRLDLSRINSENIIAKMDLNGLKEGETRVPIHVAIQEQSGKITVLNVEPASVIVNIEKIITENVRIEVETNGTLEDGYTLGEVKAVNGIVAVTGPESRVGDIAKAVSYVDITSKREGFITNTPVSFFDKNGVPITDLKTNVSTIDIEIPIYKIKSVPIEPIYSGQLLENQRLDNVKITPAQVVIKGDGNRVNEIAKISTMPIEYEKLNDSGSVVVNLDLPSNITLYDENLEVTLKYTLVDNIQKAVVIPKDNFEIRNKETGLTYEITTEFESINVILYGETESLEVLTGGDLIAYIDVDNLSAGEYTLDIKVNGLGTIAAREIVPGKLALIISAIN